ncbi:transposase, partial [Staphylococcus pseudintermedius]|uniref:transposase n=1 Tax=Staphylococcus pseudintermedius TaxID=283734 RepID=UPI0036F303F9
VNKAHKYVQKLIEIKNNSFPNVDKSSFLLQKVQYLCDKLLIGELGNIREFKTNKQLNAFVGIDIKRYQSGTSKSRDTINK